MSKRQVENSGISLLRFPRRDVTGGLLGNVVAESSALAWLATLAVQGVSQRRFFCG